MPIKAKRKIWRSGGSTVITLPYVISTGEYATMAGNSLLLIDPRGEIPEDDLLEFYMGTVEPKVKAIQDQKGDTDGIPTAD